MKISINYLGIIALALMFLSSIPGFGLMGLVLGVTVTTMLYAEIDKLGFGTRLLNFTLVQWVIMLIPIGAVLYYGIAAYMKSIYSMSILFALVIVALLMFLAISNYFIAKSLLIVAHKTNNFWFKLSGGLTMVGAFSMPILLGLFFVFLAQPFFLIGCITHKEIVKSEEIL